VADVVLLQTSLRTLEALRTAHLAFIRQTAAQKTKSGEPIRAFIEGARTAGRYLQTDDERETAQRILDYWSAELIATPDAREDDFRPPLLDPPSSDAAEGNEASQPEEAEVASARVDKSQKRRQLIRLSAQARQWRDNGRAPGYLLTGDALSEAAEYAEEDSDVAALVLASEKAERAATRQATRTKTAAIFVLVVLTCIAVAFAVFAYFERQAAVEALNRA
jgi:hypothetical protein